MQTPLAQPGELNGGQFVTDKPRAGLGGQQIRTHYDIGIRGFVWSVNSGKPLQLAGKSTGVQTLWIAFTADLYRAIHMNQHKLAILESGSCAFSCGGIR